MFPATVLTSAPVACLPTYASLRSVNRQAGVNHFNAWNAMQQGV